MVDDAFSFRDSVGDLSSDDCPVGDFCPLAAAAAACCARSFRDAFPRFFRSRMYSQPKPNSTFDQRNVTDPLRNNELTDTVRARVLPIAFRPQLVTLIARPANSPPDGSRGTSSIDRSAIATCPVSIWMLTMFGIVISVDLRILMDIHVLLKLLERVLRPVRERIETRGMHMIGGNMPIGEHVAGW